jgi:hypothetical protein
VGLDQRGDDRSNTVDLAQRRSGRLDGVTDAGLDGNEVPVEAAHVTEEIHGKLSALRSDGPVGSDAAEQFRGLFNGQSPGCAARDELPEHRMEPTCSLSPQRHKVVVAADKEAHDGRVVVRLHRTEPAVAQPGDRGREGVVAVVLRRFA